MQDESVFLNSGNVYVSNARVTIGGTTYATANLTSVEGRVAPPKRGCALALIIFGGIALAGGCMAVLSDPNSVGNSLGSCALSVAIIAAGVVWFKALKPTYRVLLASASGQVEALSSKDEELIDSVIAAINAAMVHRG